MAALGVSGYLTADHFESETDLACSVGGPVDCDRVITSPQSEVSGIPVAVLGMGWSTGMIVLSIPRLWRSGSRPVRIVRLVLAWGGVAFVAWLVYAEVFLIGAVCLWCTVVHALALALFGLIVLKPPRAMLGP